jgi:hypothetical protein
MWLLNCFLQQSLWPDHYLLQIWGHRFIPSCSNLLLSMRSSSHVSDTPSFQKAFLSSFWLQTEQIGLFILFPCLLSEGFSEGTKIANIICLLNKSKITLRLSRLG